MKIFIDNSSTGFLIGIYFLALAVVALTLVYFSRPRNNSQLVKNTPEIKEPEDSKIENSSKFTLKRSMFKMKSLFQRPNWFVKLSRKSKNQPAPGEVVSSGPLVQEPTAAPQPLERPVSVQQPVEETPNVKEVKLAPVEKSSVQAELVSPIPPKEEKPDSAQLPIKEVQTDDEVKPAETNKEGAVANESKPINPSPSVIDEKQGSKKIEEKQANEVVKPAETKKEGTVATESKATSPSLTIINEKGGSTKVEEKQKTAATDGDFADLFSGDGDEDNEVSRLAKELNEIETRDILEDSRDLISQFKKTKN